MLILKASALQMRMDRVMWHSCLIIFVLYTLSFGAVEFDGSACVFGQTPSPIRVLPLIQAYPRGRVVFSLLFNMLVKLLLLDKRR